MNKSEQLIACLEGEIAKRDARIVELERAEKNDAIAYKAVLERQDELRAELAAIKAKSVMPDVNLAAKALCSRHAAICGVDEDDQWKEYGQDFIADAETVLANSRLYAAPVSEAKAQGEYGDAYQGAREDLAIWKQRALKAEEKVRQQEQIIDHLTSEAQGESRFGEPVITAGEPCVPDGYVLADKKSLGMVLQALVNAPHHIRELQVTRQPVELFSDNPINVLIANYEAPAAPVQQVSVSASAFESRAITHYEAALKAAFPSGSSGEVFSQWNEARRVLAAAPAAPAADAGVNDHD